MSVALIRRIPFREPHHSASMETRIGGSAGIRPMEAVYSALTAYEKLREHC